MQKVDINKFVEANKTRLDIFVRVISIEKYMKDHNYDFGLYVKMQKYRCRRHSSDKYVNDFKSLINSFITTKKYDDKFPIVCDVKLNLLDGAHRIACCIYFNIDPYIIIGNPRNIRIDVEHMKKFFDEKIVDNIIMTRNKYVKK